MRESSQVNPPELPPVHELVAHAVADYRRMVGFGVDRVTAAAFVVETYERIESDAHLAAVVRAVMAAQRADLTEARSQAASHAQPIPVRPGWLTWPRRSNRGDR